MAHKPQIIIALLISLLLIATNLYGQRRVGREKIPMPSAATATDSTIVSKTERSSETEDSENVLKFYDSLRSKSRDSGFSRFLYNAMIRNPAVRKDKDRDEGKFVDDGQHYEPFRGKIIGEVIIWRERIYDNNVRGLRRYANSVHAVTREGAIKRDLQFKSGDMFDPDEIVRNNHLLRSRPYFSDVDIDIVPRVSDTTIVDIVVRTHDKWTVSMDGAWKKEGRTMFEIYDANIFGSGNRLSIKTHLNRRNFNYHGNLVQYSIENLLGTFYRVNLIAGRAFEDQRYAVTMYKDFMKPTDYDIGFTFSDEHREYYQLYKDTITMTKSSLFSFWGGKSFHLKRLKSSIYMTSKYSRVRFRERPDTDLEPHNKINPAFQDLDELLFGIGFYRERFLSTNMIYGYGNREYLTIGYKTELVTGYSWGEFSNDIYLGINLIKGGFSSMGYFVGRATLGSYVNPNSGAWERSGVDVDLRWISNLWGKRRSRVRQFLTLSYTHGWNRWEGNNEVITYTKENGPTSIDEWMIGNTRMVLNTETVVFTPWKPFGFSIAIFGFTDFGLLGFDPNPFDNPFCTTIGFGVRLKNERLVFKTIQLRLGVALGKSGFLHNRYLWLSNEQRMNQYRFIPSYPEVVHFK